VEQAPSLPNNDRWKNSHNQAVERFTYRGKSYSLFATSNHPRKKASLALAIPFHGALSAHEGGKAFGVAVMETISNRNASKPSPPPQKPLTDRVEQNSGARGNFRHSF
jgi:hypothetical protein